MSHHLTKNLHLKQNSTEWPKMIVRDNRDAYDKLLTEKSGLPQQKALTLEIATFREWLVNSDAHIRWTADENMFMNGLTKDNNVKMFFFLEPNEKGASVSGDRADTTIDHGRRTGSNCDCMYNVLVCG